MSFDDRIRDALERATAGLTAHIEQSLAAFSDDLTRAASEERDRAARQAAEAAAAGVRREADEEVARLRAAAEAQAIEITRAADAQVGELRQRLQAQLDDIRRVAHAQADQARRSADAAMDDARRAAAAQVETVQRRADAQLDETRRDFGHQIESLRERARVDLEQARAEVEQARADLERARSDLERARSDLETTRMEADTAARAAQAEVDAANAQAASTAQVVRAEADQMLAARLAAARAEADEMLSARLAAALAEADARLAAAQAEADATLAARLAAAQAEADAAVGARLATAQAEAEKRIVDAVRALDDARSLGEALDALAEGAAHHVARAAVLIVRGDRLRARRLAGFSGEHAEGSINLDFDEAGLAGAVVSTGVSVSRPAVEPGDEARTRQPALPPFAQDAGARHAVALPIVVGGRVVGVLYADAPQAEAQGTSRWPAVLEVLTRHASRALEAMTVHRVAGLSRARPMPPVAGAARGHGGGAGDEEAARRYARLLVSEIRMYHQPVVDEGRRSRDLRARLGGEIDRARQLYEERVAPAIRERSDFFEQELVRTLADGDRSLLG